MLAGVHQRLTDGVFPERRDDRGGLHEIRPGTYDVKDVHGAPRCLESSPRRLCAVRPASYGADPGSQQKLTSATKACRSTVYRAAFVEERKISAKVRLGARQ